MGIFSEIFSKRTPEIRTVDNSPQELLKEKRGLYGGETSFDALFKSDIPVNEDTINLIPVAVSCLELITSAVAQLPIRLYRKLPNGDVEVVEDDKRTYLLNIEPNQHLTGYNYKKQMVRDYLLYGGSYSYVERNRNEIEGLYLLPAKNTQRVKVFNKQKPYKSDYEIKFTASSETGTHIYQPHDLFICLRNTFDGANTLGILEQGEVTFKLALAAMEYNVNVLNKGALPVGVLESQNRLTEPALKRLRKSWETLYAGVKNSGKTIILEEGLKYNPISLNPGELQLTESKKLAGEDISKLFNVPYSMVSSDGNKYNSVEQNNLHFLEYTLNPILVNFEASLDKMLLLESEKEQGDLFFEFDTSEIMTMTQSDLIDNLNKATKGGLYSLNEARSDLRKPKIKKEFLQFGLGSVFYDMNTEEMVIPNMATTIDKDGKFHNANLKEDNSDVQTSAKDSKVKESTSDDKDDSTDEDPTEVKEKE